jgi:polyphosphate kinase 2 (PPK2 family)
MTKKDKQKRDDARLQASSEAGRQDAGAVAPPKMKRKAYEREMRVLHGELVAMQEWVKDSGAKICIVFEGRDTAGKGGTIKRFTEWVSPRVFRDQAVLGTGAGGREAHGRRRDPAAEVPARGRRRGRSFRAGARSDGQN